MSVDARDRVSADRLILLAELEDALRRSGADQKTVDRIVQPIAEWVHAEDER